MGKNIHVAEPLSEPIVQGSLFQYHPGQLGFPVLVALPENTKDKNGWLKKFKTKERVDEKFWIIGRIKQ